MPSAGGRRVGGTPTSSELGIDAGWGLDQRHGDQGDAQVALSMAAQATGDPVAARSFLDDARAVIQACPNPGPVVTALLTELSPAWPLPVESHNRSSP